MDTLSDRASALSDKQTDDKWIQIIEEWRKSGQSIAEWVREQNEFTYNQFIKARTRLFPEEIARSEFMEKETTWSALSVNIPTSTIDVFVSDCRLVVKTGFDQELLKEIVEVLRDAN